MKKSILIVFILISISSMSIAAPQAAGPDSLIIPQNDKIYGDLYAFAEKGYIKSVDADHFKYAPISSYEAAGYVCEALLNVAKVSGDAKSKKADIEALEKYYETYKAKAVEIYNKTNDMKAKLKDIEAIIASPELQEFKEEVKEISSGLYDIEQEMKLTTFRGVPPFKVMGMIQARWQDIDSFGISHVHHTSLGGTFMQLWTEGIVSPDVSFKLNITFERPANEAEKGAPYFNMILPEYWGTGQRFLDTYTISLNAFGWRSSTGFFWDDITPFVAKQILTERPVLFDRDPYALEETARGHYENLFLHSFEKRGDIWSKHGWYGIGLYNMNFVLGSMIKIMAGKAEKFDELYDKHYLYEYAARWSFPIELQGILNNTQISGNFFNTSADRGEVETLAPAADADFPDVPDGYIQSQTIAGADFKANMLDFLQVSGEAERSTYDGKMPKPFVGPDYVAAAFVREGNAVFGQAGFTLGPVKIEAKYQQIDPDYVATASAVLDTLKPTLTIAGNPLTRTTYAGDPTMLWNNSQRESLFANITVPNGFILLNYGTSKQLAPTGDELYMEHFLFGNRLNGSIYWHLFFSNYGNPTYSPGTSPGPANIYDGINNYNRNTGGTLYASTGSYVGAAHEMITDLWLTNKEDIYSNYPGAEDSIKYYNNASVEFRYQLNKLLGIENDFFVQAYGELDTLLNGEDLIVDFNPQDLLCQQVVSAFAVYNLTRKMNIMATWGIERWVTNWSSTPADPNNIIPVDYYDTMYGIGFDYDFAPRTALFLRAKKFIHEDRVTPANSFNGWELFAELKNFF